MARFTVRKGKHYSATIKLTGLKRLASNETIAGVLRGVGFAEVAVAGSGGTRYAAALWPKADATADIPPEVVKVEEIEAIAGPARMLRKPKASARPRRKTKAPARPRRKTKASAKPRPANPSAE